MSSREQCGSDKTADIKVISTKQSDMIHRPTVHVICRFVSFCGSSLVIRVHVHVKL